MSPGTRPRVGRPGVRRGVRSGVRRPPARCLAALAACWLALAAAQAGAGVPAAGQCPGHNEPAATLLIPYFEVDLDSAAGRFSVGQEMTPLRRPDCQP